MTMQSLSLLTDLVKLPAAEDVATLEKGEIVSRIRAMDRNHFSIEVSQATEEVMEALFDARNIQDDLVNDLTEAYRRSFSSFADQGRSVHEHFQEMMGRGPESVRGFISNLKGKVAEVKVESVLEERFPGYDFQLASNPTEKGWDLKGESPDGEDIFIQSKFGAEEYADEVLDAMQEYPNYPFAVSSEIYDTIEQVQPELLGRLIDMGSAAELTASIKDGLGKLAGNFGVDIPDSIGEALPYVGEVVLGIKLIFEMVKTKRELADVDLTDRSKVQGIRMLALGSRFGINQVCMWAGGAGGSALGSLVPGAGNVLGALAGGLAGLGGGIILNRLLQPRIEEVAMKLIGGDADDMFYLMNKIEIDNIGQSLAETQIS